MRGGVNRREEKLKTGSQSKRGWENVDETQKTILALFLGGLLSLLTGVVTSFIVHKQTLDRELALNEHRVKREARDKARDEYKAALAATLEWADTLGSILTSLLLLFGMYRKEKPSVGQALPYIHDAILPSSGKMPRPPGHQLALLKPELYEPLDKAQAALAVLHIVTAREKGMPSMEELEFRVQDAFDEMRGASERLQEEYRLQVPNIGD